MSNPFLERIVKNFVLFDGGTGSTLISFNIPEKDFHGHENCNSYLNISRPDLVEKVAEGYFEAGADCSKTNTFAASKIQLKNVGLENRIIEINKKGAEIVKKATEKYSAKETPRLVVGITSSTGILPSMGEGELVGPGFEGIATAAEEQVTGLIQGGADMIVVETQQDIIETKASIIGAKNAMQKLKTPLPLIAEATIEQNGKMLMGAGADVFLATMQALDVDVIGTNCGLGPKEMAPATKFLCENSTTYVSARPNAGMPKNIDGKAVYDLSPEDFADYMKKFVVEYGADIIGGCCGSNKLHIKKTYETLKGAKKKQRKPVYFDAVASPTKTVKLDKGLVIVGERTNATGSRKFKELLIKENMPEIIELAREQENTGAQVLDLNVSHNDLKKSEEYYFEKLIKKFSLSCSAPIMIDSTNPKAMEIALQHCPGKPIINSANLEDPKKFEKVCALAKKYGAALVLLTIEENGMAESKEDKIRVARRLYKLATEQFGLRDENLIFDMLTFPVTTGQEKYKTAAIETIDAIKEIKKALPKCKTILGISNISFGVGTAARAALNNVFLHHAAKAGLNFAIINPSQATSITKIPKNERTLCENLLFNRTKDVPPLAEFIKFFEGRKETTEKTEKSAHTHLSPEEQLREKIIKRSSKGLEELLDTLREKHRPGEIINEILLPAMREVGELMSRGKMILPFVLDSASVMKKSIGYLDKFMDKDDKYQRGKIVLATVFGDVHDIGKDLVKTILQNNGFEVIDLGKQVPRDKIISTAVKENADAIGLSALLVSTSVQMKQVVEELAEKNLEFPVIIGGASVNSSFAERIRRLENGRQYKGEVLYANDAFQALDYASKIVESTTPPTKHSPTQKSTSKTKTTLPEKTTSAGNSELKKVKIPKAPFYGTKIIENIPLDKVYSLLNLDYIYKLHWGVRCSSNEEYNKLIKTKFNPILEKLKKEAMENKWLEPKAIYGFFPCYSLRNSLHVLDPKTKKEAVEFIFPRQPKNENICLADYFSGSRENPDVLGVQIVTVGPNATSACNKFNKKGEYSKTLYLHGLSVEIAEATAKYMHSRVRKELSIEANQGERYSIGYPSCPDLSDQKKLFKLLKPERIGISLTSAFQMVPEQTTSAMIIHNKHARHFTI